MTTTMTGRVGSGRALLAAVGLAVATAASGQAPPASTAAATPAKAAKPASKAGGPAFKLVVEAKAMELLKAASVRLAAAKSMAFTATISYEFPSQLGPPIVYTARYDVAMQRPDKLRILMQGDGPTSELYYDGRTMIAYAPAEDLAAVAEAPPTIDAALRFAYETAAIYYPFTDLMVADPYASLADRAKLAFVIGPSDVVGGTRTDMVAWASDEVFLQVWIGADDRLPRRIRAVYLADPLRLRHDLELSNWKIDQVSAQDLGASAKAKAGKRIAFASPVPPPATGSKPLGKAKPVKPSSTPKSP